MLRWDNLLPAPARYLLLACQTVAARLRKDDGDVMGAVIIAAGFAAIAVLIVITITGKVQAFLGKIP